VVKAHVGNVRACLTALFPIGGEGDFIEVKGLSHDQHVELSGNEADAADRCQDSFYLCVVSSIPENPAMYMVRNPARWGRKDKLTVPINIKSFPFLSFGHGFHGYTRIRIEISVKSAFIRVQIKRPD
jgi:hypothetical protein